MGSWSVYCGISNIAITAGQKCVLLPLKKTTNEYYEYSPATLPIFGEYDDYGGIENVELNDNTKFIESEFDCTIDEFCHFFTRGCVRTDEDDFPTKLLENELLKKWTFTFIDRKVYDFMIKHAQNGFGGRGYFDMGNPELLTYIGFQYLHENGDGRYKKVWKFDGKEFGSDGTWLNFLGNKQGVYTFEDLSEIVNIPEDRKWLSGKTEWQIWKIFNDEKRLELLCSGVGVSRQYIMGVELFERLNKEYGTMSDKFAYKYLQDLDKFGDSLADMVNLQVNLRPMSGYLQPHKLYVTPQCGEYEEHQILLDKFAEINREYVEEREEFYNED